MPTAVVLQFITTFFIRINWLVACQIYHNNFHFIDIETSMSLFPFNDGPFGDSTFFGLIWLRSSKIQGPSGKYDKVCQQILQVLSQHVFIISNHNSKEFIKFVYLISMSQPILRFHKVKLGDTIYSPEQEHQNTKRSHTDMKYW